jgi:hypothetical protein
MWLCPDITPLLDDVVHDIVKPDLNLKFSERGSSVPVTKKEIKNAEKDIFETNSASDLWSHDPSRSIHM